MLDSVWLWLLVVLGLFALAYFIHREDGHGARLRPAQLPSREHRRRGVGLGQVFPGR